MHDGGTQTEIYLNDKMICNSVPQYGKSKPAHGHGEGRKKRQAVYVGGSVQDNENIEHILRQSTCEYADGIAIKKGDTMYQKVVYDFNRHPG